MRGETESIAKQHQNIAAQMRRELEEPLAAFAGGMKERRKIVQNTIEKLLKIKVQQTQLVNKTRDRFEQESLKIKGYLAQGHMVMGQEERKNKAKLEKTQISLATSNTEYEAAVKALEETTGRWNSEWKRAADKFQDLEEERLDFTKNSLWNFANISSTVCVSDDQSCEKIRLSLESMEVQKDIITFITERGTGQEIPDPPKYINFCRGDVDSQSEASVDLGYSVAQFPRSINPAFRSSSPQPSLFESHHDPDNGMALEMGHGDAATPRGRETAAAPQKMAIMPAAPVPALAPAPESQRSRSQAPRAHQQPRANLEYDPNEFAPVPHDPYPMDGMTMLCRPTASDLSTAPSSNLSARPSSRGSHSETSFSSQEPAMAPVKREPQRQLQQEPRREIQQDPRRELQQDPRREIQQDPRRELQREPTRELQRETTRELQREPTRELQREPTRELQRETTREVQRALQREKAPVEAALQEQKIVKKKSGFFQNHSPFRRKSTKEVAPAAQPANRNTWHQNSSQPRLQLKDKPAMLPERTASPDPIAANASLALNIGGNVFQVENTDKRAQVAQQSQAPPPDDDPIALALAELRGVTSGVPTNGAKQASSRVSADRYHGLATPAPGLVNPLPRSTPTLGSSAAQAGIRGTPPPYDQQVQRLGVPPPACTSKAMKESSQKFQQQTRSLFSEQRPGSGYGGGAAMSRPGTRGSDMPRAASPAAPRSHSPRPGSQASGHYSNHQRSASPNPYAGSMRGSTSSQNMAVAPKRGGSDLGYANNSYSQRSDISRAASPSPYGGSRQDQYNGRPSSSNDMAMQLADDGGSQYGGSQRGRGGQGGSHSRAMSFYEGAGPVAPVGRQRSKSAAPDGRGYTRDGRKIMHFGEYLPASHLVPFSVLTVISASNVHVPGSDPRGAGLRQGRHVGGAATPRRRVVGGDGAGRHWRSRLGAQQLPPGVLSKCLVGGMKRRGIHGGSFSCEQHASREFCIFRGRFCSYSGMMLGAQFGVCVRWLEMSRRLR